MKDRPKPSTRGLCALSGALALSGCASALLVKSGELFEPIERATTTPPAVLRSGAEAGSAVDQLAMSVVLYHGLNGVRRDSAEAALWRSRALATRGTQPITQYTAPFNGQPSRVNVIYVPRYEVSAVQIDQVERCAADLEAGVADSRMCGSPETRDRLTRFWRTADPS